MSSNIHVFTHHDLDGIGSLLALIWAFPDANITYTTVSNPQEFASKFQDKYFTSKINTYNKIFITDLSILEKDIPLIDKENVVFIDHHISSVNLKFKYAKNIIKKYSSCAMLIYKSFKDRIDISNSQKQLLIYIDDYDSYQLKFKKSWEINCLFWEMYSKNIGNFLLDYNEGYKELNSVQTNIVNNYKQKIDATIRESSLHSAVLTIQDSTCNVGAMFSDFAINDIASYIINTQKKDIAVVINLKTNRVSFRKSSTCSVNMAKFALHLCEGSGHEAAAGGPLTENFLEFSRVFK